MSEERRRFEAETQKVLNLMIHSLYSNKDIFLRELVANASDAIDKARFFAIQHKEAAADWEIRIDADKEAGRLAISDNGIGMDRDEAIRALGVIAHSGTMAFLKTIDEKDMAQSPELIGQFGVGFYSAFMVADKVVVTSKRAGSDAPAVRWESDGQGEYTVSDASRAEQGTTVELHLKPDAKIYLEPWKIREVVKKYSDFIEYPVRMERKDRKDPAEEKFETLNARKAIWLRPAKEVSEEEYLSFFRHLSRGEGEYLERIHYSAEGAAEFKALLYIPIESPFSFFMPDDRSRSLSLYIRKVFITAKCPGLIPEYMRFLDGVVDSADLPLNISRETLQDNPVVMRIQKNLVRKVLETLKKCLEENRSKYLDFFKANGRFLKEGVHSDFGNREKLAELLLFETLARKPGEYATLKEYVAAMPAGQKEIYYIACEGRPAAEAAPQAELLRSKGYDILLFTEPIDELALVNLHEFDGKRLRNALSGKLDIDGAPDTAEAAKELAPLFESVKKALDGRVSEVRASNRLVDSPACLVGGEFDHSPMVEKLMRVLHKEPLQAPRAMELNPSHPLVKAMADLQRKDAASPRLAECAEMLYDQALLLEGSPLPDPARFAKRLSSLMVASVSTAAAP